MMNTKRRGNVPPQNDSEERESLMSGGGIEMTSKRTPTRATLRSGNTSPHRREKRKTSGVMDKDDEERVSLIGGGGGGGGGRRPQGGRRPLRIADTRRRTVFNMFSVPKFNMNTIMRYIGLMLASATVSFMLFHRQPRTVHWGQYNKVLEPDVGRGTRCFVSIYFSTYFVVNVLSYLAVLTTNNNPMFIEPLTAPKRNGARSPDELIAIAKQFLVGSNGLGGDPNLLADSFQFEGPVPCPKTPLSR